MVSVAVWSVGGNEGPHRLAASPPESEAALEDWVKADPTLVRDGLVVVAQQLIFSSKERLDLLCIENRSRWLIVELKRDRLAREVAAQALDYASLLSDMSQEELRDRLDAHLQKVPSDVRELVDALIDSETDDSPREIAAVVVGITADEPLLRITRFLTQKYGVPMSVVELQAFLSPSGDRLLLREETGSAAETDTTDSVKPAATVDERWARVQASAAASGCADALEAARERLAASPIYLRPYARSVMIAPASNRTRYLGVIGFMGKAGSGLAHLSYGAEALQEFFPALDPGQITSALGPASMQATSDDIVAFADRLALLLDPVATASND